ncbi:MAG: coiled-coil domain-containing protein [Promethearchaeota archaeon]
MVEIGLEDFEDFYKDKINTHFFKVKKASKKLISDIRNNLIEIKICMDHFRESGMEKIDHKSQRSLHLFSDRIKNEIDQIEIPDEIYYTNLNELLNSIKKLFNTINEIARKALPKIQKEVQPEIKELNYRTRKLGKKQIILDKFLRSKYMEVRSAEDLLNKLPKLFGLKDNIENAKTDLDHLENEIEERKNQLEKLNLELLEIEKNDLFKQLEKERENLFQLKIRINEEIGFKKALKKLKFELDKETLHISNINLNYLKNFLKDPIAILGKESKDLPKFSALLVHLRHVLEEGDKLNLKTDTREKTIEQINKIFTERKIYTDIENLRELNNKIREFENKIKETGLSKKLEEIKNQISITTVKLEHTQNDFDRKNKDYLRYLGALKEERENFQNSIEEVISEAVKINISFSF